MFSIQSFILVSGIQKGLDIDKLCLEDDDGKVSLVLSGSILGFWNHYWLAGVRWVVLGANKWKALCFVRKASLDSDRFHQHQKATHEQSFTISQHVLHSEDFLFSHDDDQFHHKTPS